MDKKQLTISVIAKLLNKFYSFQFNEGDLFLRIHFVGFDVTIQVVDAK